MRLVLLSLLLLVPSSLLANVAVEIAASDEGPAIFASVLRSGWNGLTEIESAAFIVIDEEARYRCREWPYTGELRKMTYRGAPPPFTVAIAHTHPKSMPRPSRGDLATAAAVGVPVFVLTPTNITAAMPDGSILTIVGGRDWPRAVRTRRSCRAEPLGLSLSAE